MKSVSFCISFSGITLRFTVPEDTQIEEDLVSLQIPCSDVSSDAEFRILRIDTPLHPEGEPVGSASCMKEYITQHGRLRIYSPLIDEDGCQVACLLCPDGKHTLYYPASRWEHYSRPLHCLHLIAPELLLAQKNAFLLHSSVIQYRKKALLFAGPSGIGKSTQAELWQKYRNAQILNGDRCVVMEKNGLFFGGGSPWCGTSGIRRPEQYPIAGILILRQASVNRLVRLGTDALVPLLSQTVLNSWNPDMMQTVTELYAGLLTQVPIYRLECRPDEEAVSLVHQTFFGEE